MAKSTLALEIALQPLKPFLDNENINEIMINQPGVVWIEQSGVMTSTPVEIDFKQLYELAQLAATYSEQYISEKTPLISGTLPSGERIQIVTPPACPPDRVIIAIRRQHQLKLSLDDYEAQGAFDTVTPMNESNDQNTLLELYKEKQYKDFLKVAIKCKKNIIFSGGTSTGKTTFLRTAISEIGKEERIVTIEDALELEPDHQNVASLLYSRNKQGLSQIGPEELLEASLRLRPDRIILGEIRGNEAFSFLQAVATGHDGSLSSVHASSPRLAFEQIALKCLQKTNLSYDNAVHYVKSVIDIVVQWKREKGRRYISDIWYREDSDE